MIFNLKCINDWMQMSLMALECTTSVNQDTDFPEIQNTVLLRKIKIFETTQMNK